jgi:S1-C subfamily serine protease
MLSDKMNSAIAIILAKELRRIMTKRLNGIARQRSKDGLIHKTTWATVATVGFPNIGLQGFAPKLAKGEIASLSGAGDDARYFQISVPVQPGNSGGALVDERGNVVGIVSAKLSARVALAESGALPENVNYAVKSSFLLGFLESVPEVSAKLKEPETKERKFEDVVKSAEQAAVLVLVY